MPPLLGNRRLKSLNPTFQKRFLSGNGMESFKSNLAIVFPPVLQQAFVSHEKSSPVAEYLLHMPWNGCIILAYTFSSWKLSSLLRISSAALFVKVTAVISEGLIFDLPEDCIWEIKVLVFPRPAACYHSPVTGRYCLPAMPCRAQAVLM